MERRRVTAGRADPPTALLEWRRDYGADGQRGRSKNCQIVFKGEEDGRQRSGSQSWPSRRLLSRSHVHPSRTLATSQGSPGYQVRSPWLASLSIITAMPMPPSGWQPNVSWPQSRSVGDVGTVGEGGRHERDRVGISQDVTLPAVSPEARWWSSEYWSASWTYAWGFLSRHWVRVLPVIAVLGIGAALGEWIRLHHYRVLYPMLRSEVAEAAMQRFGRRWLGLWSPGDEALGGLATSSRPVSIEIAPRLRSGSSLLGGSLVGHFVLDTAPGPIVTGFYNHVIARRGDRMVTAALIKGLQGDDVPGGVRELTVAPGPIPSNQWAATYPPLPAETVHTLRRRVDQAAQDALPAVRQILCESALGGLGVKDFFVEVGRGLSGKELVHTTYLDSDDVLELISAHIEAMSDGETGGDRLSGARQWVRQFKATLQNTVLAGLPPLEPSPRSVLLRSRRFGGGPIFVRPVRR
jgi:hypothetical protein